MTEFKKLRNGRALYVTSDKIWMAKGMKFFAIDNEGRRVSPIFKIGIFRDRILGSHRLVSQLTRIGIHHLIPLENGNFLVTTKRKTYIVSPDGKVVITWCDYQGNKPGHQGICVTPTGTIFFAEYLLNPHRDCEVHLWRSIDNGMTWHIVKTWSKGDIRHLHFVKWDDFEKCLWVGTGDYGENGAENRLYRSVDNGDTWELVGQGSQDWRAIGVCFASDALFWGTDAGSCPDEVHLVKMNRDTQQISILDNLEGPCHGCASFADGRVFFSTGIEGGENEKDRYAHLKEYKNGRLEEVLRIKKDIWPEVLQIGAMRFPLGSDNRRKVVFTAMGLTGHGEVVMTEV